MHYQLSLCRVRHDLALWVVPGRDKAHIENQASEDLSQQAAGSDLQTKKRGLGVSQVVSLDALNLAINIHVP
ncbi:hypothetical protein NDU88_004521 [Pleurodeles waltl]|uniref:Uncharacterized protein n=1 Tax=Pleurodeles waltl TaxID=8319 RepID=A0AAV7VKJ4_PLEWA|nr:hypothetical protein NDU88_004521 [Pleurodeles waltl]